MPLSREVFRNNLDELAALLQQEATAVSDLLRLALQAIHRGDVRAADETILGDDRIDALNVQIEQHIELLLAREAPVATDLRLILSSLHVNQHLERMGDQCVNIAKLVKLTIDEAPLPDDLVELFREMGAQALAMIDVAMASFAERDLARAESLVEMDQVINRANHGLVGRIMNLNGTMSQQAGLHAIMISRCLERIGDNAVDIGERTAYLVTADVQEFTDASHPVT